MNGTMLAMRLRAAGSALSLDTVARPDPQDHEVLFEVLACGVCRTDFACFTGHTLNGGYADELAYR